MSGRQKGHGGPLPCLSKMSPWGVPLTGIGSGSVGGEVSGGSARKRQQFMLTCYDYQCAQIFDEVKR
jgi:hypothetical protein